MPWIGGFSGATLWWPFSNFRFGVPQTGSIADRDWFAEALLGCRTRPVESLGLTVDLGVAGHLVRIGQRPHVACKLPQPPAGGKSPRRCTDHACSCRRVIPWVRQILVRRHASDQVARLPSLYLASSRIQFSVTPGSSAAELGPRALVVRADRLPPLVVIPLRLAVEIAAAAETEHRRAVVQRDGDPSSSTATQLNCNGDVHEEV